MAGVLQGRTPMTNADVYAGVVSAVKGPQIQDPTNEIAHHSSLLSTIGDVVKNVPKDIGGMVTGLEGIPHILLHLPQEVDNTGKLLYNLAEGNNNYLHKNGYLPAGENLHESWSDWAKILRAMNTHGEKQLLPFLPFLSDIANMTNGQGRQFLQQHPVGAFLDVLPGIVKAGHLATDSMALEGNAEARGLAVEQYKLQGMSEAAARARVDVERPADYSNIYRTSAPGTRDPTVPTKRFYAAGRALQTGNPVKAVFSAAGDLIPAGRDDIGTRITARDYINMRAAASGLDIKIREAINRPINNLTDELSAHSKYLRDKIYGNTTFFKRDKNSVVRNQYMYMVTHMINPLTGEMFKDQREMNAYINATFSEHERADINMATAISAKQQIEAVQSGRAVQIPDPHYGGVNLFKTDSRVHKAYMKSQDAAAAVHDAETSGNAERLVKATAAMEKAYQDFRKVTWEVAPDAWHPAIGEMMRSKYKTEVEARVAAGEMDAEDLKNVTADLATSPWESEYKRLMGDDAYKIYLDDAMQQWRILQSSGANPLWTHEMDPADYNVIFNPKVSRVDKPVTPEAYAAETHTERGMYFGSSVQNVGVLLSNHAVELVREQAVTRFLHDIVIPQFTVDIVKTRRDYHTALLSAAQAGKLKRVGPWSVDAEVNRIVNSNFRQFNPLEFGIKAEKAGIDPHTLQTRYITKEAENALRKVFSESTFSQSGLPIWRTGTKIYKFAVLTGVRHLVHVGLGSAMFMLMRDPMAVRDLWTAHRYLKVLRSGQSVAEDIPALAKLGLTGHTASGILERPYNMSSLHQYHNAQFGAQIGQDLATSWIHDAGQKGLRAVEFVPQKLAALEERILDMYRAATMLSNFRRSGDATAALEAAHKTFVDVNGMTNIERTVIKQIFPFYAFTRHLFRYLFQFPVDYPLRAAIISQFAEGEQQDWTSGLPRSYMSMYWLGQPDRNGNIHTFDMKNLNPFRSFANDFSVAGFLSSLSPFLDDPVSALRCQPALR